MRIADLPTSPGQERAAKRLHEAHAAAFERCPPLDTSLKRQGLRRAARKAAKAAAATQRRAAVVARRRERKVPPTKSGEA